MTLKSGTMLLKRLTSIAQRMTSQINYLRGNVEILTAERNPSGREGLWHGALKENKHTQAMGKGETVYTERKHRVQSGPMYVHV